MRRITRILPIIGAVLLIVSTNTAATALEDGSGQSLTVTPSAAAPGDTVTISGRLECPASAPGGHVLGHVEYVDDDLWVRAGWDGGGDTAASYPQLDADRRFSVDWTIPTTMHDRVSDRSVPTPAGTFYMFVFCGEGTGPGTQADTTFTVLPPTDPTTTTIPTTTTSTGVETSTTITEPAEGWTPPAQPPTIAEVFENRPIGAVPAGSTIQIDEDGFTPGEEVHVVLYSSPRVLASLVADATGAVRATVTIPADTEPGEHVLVLYGSQMVRAMAFTVTAATDPGGTPPPAETPDGGDAPAPDGATPAPSQGGAGTSGGSPTMAGAAATLPRTGSENLVLALVGTGLLGLGAVMLRMRRTLTAVDR